MIKAIAWKEWREHRWKCIAYWVLLNLPMLMAATAVALAKGARAPFGDLANPTAVKYVGVALLGESLLMGTLFFLVTGFLAVATFSQDIEEGSLFFLYEQPISRWRYFTAKLSIGAIHTAAAVACSVLLAPAIAYALELFSGKVTLAGSSGMFAMTMATAARAAIWCASMSLVGFTGCALVSALLPKWWTAIAGAFALIVALIALQGKFFDFIQPMFDATGTGSIGMGFGSSSQWLTVTGDIAVQALAPWRPLPLLCATVLALAFAGSAGVLYTRKELK